jgi:excisionase family DNA binding protein
VADSCTVSETPAPQPDSATTADTGTDLRANELESLVGEWLTVPDAAERLGVPLSRVRQLIVDRELLAARIGERRVTAIPAKFLDETGPRPELRGTFTVLADGGMNDDEIIEWLFTPDETLPVDGAPIDAIRAGHKTEIRRRAQELAF